MISLDVFRYAMQCYRDTKVMSDRSGFAVPRPSAMNKAPMADTACAVFLNNLHTNPGSPAHCFLGSLSLRLLNP